LRDGRVFRRTRRDINIDNAQSAGFGGVATNPNSVARGTRQAVPIHRPAFAGGLLPVLSSPLPIPPAPVVRNRLGPVTARPSVHQPSLPPAGVAPPSSVPTTPGSRLSLDPPRQTMPALLPSSGVALPAGVIHSPSATRSGRPYLRRF
jgi:hypothetical protein